MDKSNHSALNIGILNIGFLKPLNPRKPLVLMVFLKVFILKLLVVLSLSLCSLSVFAASEDDDTTPSFLTPDQAFVLQVESIKDTKDTKDTNDKPSQAKLQITIAEGYKLYQKYLKFSTLQGQALETNEIALPAAEGDDKVYHKKLEIMVPVASSNASSEMRGINIQYQGCAEAGFCYPPIRKQICINKDNSVTINEITSEQFNTLTTAKPPQESEVDHYAGMLQTKSFPLTLLAFFGIGILLAFTPCVLPMVPILANILVGQQQPLSRKRSFTLSGLYVLSMALCYAAAGLAAGLLGSHLSTSLQQPLVLISLSFLLLLFALSQLSLISVQMPGFITAAFQRIGTKEHKAGSAVGAISMGAVSALVVSPCVTPALVGALTYIGQTGNAHLGGLALFALALGMGSPLLIAASIGSHLLPKAGNWMTHIKNVTGILLLVLAGSILLRATPLNADEPSHVVQTNSPFIHIKSSVELTEAIKKAQAANKPIILDVYADWCVSCRQMDREVFEDKTILNTLSNVQLLRLDLTKETKELESLRKELGIVGPPMVLFFKPDGQEARSYRLAGKPKSSDFEALVTQFLQETHKK